MRISDWSSDVCSSDLGRNRWFWSPVRAAPSPEGARPGFGYGRSRHQAAAGFRVAAPRYGGYRPGGHERERHTGDRKSVVSGKRVSVRVDLVGRRIIKNKKSTYATHISNQ